MMTLTDARGVIVAAEKKAVEIKQPMNIAVADEALYEQKESRRVCAVGNRTP